MPGPASGKACPSSPAGRSGAGGKRGTGVRGRTAHGRDFARAADAARECTHLVCDIESARKDDDADELLNPPVRRPAAVLVEIVGAALHLLLDLPNRTAELALFHAEHPHHLPALPDDRILVEVVPVDCLNDVLDARRQVRVVLRPGALHVRTPAELFHDHRRLCRVHLLLSLPRFFLCRHMGSHLRFLAAVYAKIGEADEQGDGSGAADHDGQLGVLPDAEALNIRHGVREELCQTVHAGGFETAAVLAVSVQEMGRGRGAGPRVPQTLVAAIRPTRPRPLWRPKPERGLAGFEMGSEILGLKLNYNYII